MLNILSCKDTLSSQIEQNTDAAFRSHDKATFGEIAPWNNLAVSAY